MDQPWGLSNMTPNGLKVRECLFITLKLYCSHFGFLEVHATPCHLAKCPWCFCMVTVCMWLSDLFLVWQRALLLCQDPWGYGLFSPRQSRSPPVIYSLVQIPEIFNMHSGGDDAEIHFNSLPLSPSEPHFLHAAEYGNYVYFFYREIAVEHSNLGKVRQRTCRLWCITYSTQISDAGLYPKKVYTSLSACISATNGPRANGAHSGDDSTSH